MSIPRLRRPPKQRRITPLQHPRDYDEHRLLRISSSDIKCEAGNDDAGKWDAAIFAGESVNKSRLPSLTKSGN
ncbi:MAG: hypothetical protein ACR2H6_11210 [Pyrinomonadaceae bacterium]